MDRDKDNRLWYAVGACAVVGIVMFCYGSWITETDIKGRFYLLPKAADAEKSQINKVTNVTNLEDKVRIIF